MQLFLSARWSFSAAFIIFSTLSVCLSVCLYVCLLGVGETLVEMYSVAEEKRAANVENCSGIRRRDDGDVEKVSFARPIDYSEERVSI